MKRVRLIDTRARYGPSKGRHVLLALLLGGSAWMFWEFGAVAAALAAAAAVAIWARPHETFRVGENGVTRTCGRREQFFEWESLRSIAKVDESMSIEPQGVDQWVVRGRRGRVLFSFGPNIERCEHLAGVIAARIAAHRKARVERATRAPPAGRDRV